MIFPLLMCLLMVCALAGCASAPSDAMPPAGTISDAEPAGRSFLADVDGTIWQLQFGDGARVSIRRGGQLVYEADYALVGGQLRLTDRTGVYGCPGPPAIYTWTLQDGRLDLRRRSDPCGDIGMILHGARWEHRP